jgi:hypothetical protein
VGFNITECVGMCMSARNVVIYWVQIRVIDGISNRWPCRYFSDPRS